MACFVVAVVVRLGHKCNDVVDGGLTGETGPTSMAEGPDMGVQERPKILWHSNDGCCAE